MSANSFRNAQNIAKLKRLWGLGRTGTPIAAALGTSRGAVMGKLHRLGLLGKMQPSEKASRAGKATAAYWQSLSRRKRRALCRSISRGVRAYHNERSIAPAAPPSL